YLTELAIQLGIEDVRRIVPDPVRTTIYDPQGKLHQVNTDQCCHLRKTLPLQRALGEFSGWITGRKRFQSTTRAELPFFELDKVTQRIKLNPLIHWKPEDIKDYMQAHELPAHPLVKQGFMSIGCAPCTTRVNADEDARAGRWRGEEKIECGIHFDNAAPLSNSSKEKNT
ncbi:UNVERIFIED_CONTAM: hypothetical protein GTU68_024887, partial [Idotea baltica]|nr:hypothetical protein [Idotea baltica]